MGVTVLAVIAFTCAATAAGLAIVSLVWLVLTPFGIGRGGSGEWLGIGQAFAVVVAIVCFGFAALFARLARGLLNLRSWARAIAITMAAAILAFSIMIAAVDFISRNEYANFEVWVLPIAISAWILAYLLTPGVKRAFSAGL